MVGGRNGPSDTVKFIRTIDPNPTHIFYVEDFIGSLTDPEKPARLGLDLGRVFQDFDAVAVTPCLVGSRMPILPRASCKSTLTQSKLCASSPARRRGSYLPFGQQMSERNDCPTPQNIPAADDSIAICRTALSLGIRHLDMYGYRIGEYCATRQQMHDLVPPEPAPYRVTGQFPQRFLYYRLEVKEGLAVTSTPSIHQSIVMINKPDFLRVPGAPQP